MEVLEVLACLWSRRIIEGCAYRCVSVLHMCVHVYMWARHTRVHLYKFSIGAETFRPQRHLTEVETGGTWILVPATSLGLGSGSSQSRQLMWVTQVVGEGTRPPCC